MPLLALIALFIVLPLAELYVILKVGDAIGAVWTILLLAADSVLGSLLLRSQGRSVWRRFNTALADPKIQKRIADLGAEPMPMTPAEFGKLVANETEKWGRVVNAAHITVD